MKSINTEEDYLLISGIQHYMFCPHQWGLIHIEDVWEDNVLTFEGSLLHERVHNPELNESRGDSFTSRAVSVISHKYKIQGVIDLIEFVRDNEGLYIEERQARYKPYLVEYKRGKPKEGLEDEVQLCAQAIAFEEMKECKLDYGFIYYFQINRRIKVVFDHQLRNTVKRLLEEMVYFYSRQETPKPVKMKSCKNCSLTHVCSKNFGNKNARKYLQTIIEEMQ